MASANVSYSKKNGVVLLTIIVGGRSYSVSESHRSFRELCELLNQDNNADAVVALLTKKQAEVLTDDISIVDGQVRYMGEVVHNTAARRILEFMQAGLPFKPLARFLSRAKQNVSQVSANEGYDFLENKNLPITEDGCFLAYKAVRADWKDKYSGTLDNTPGSVVKMPRKRVDDDRRNECSNGLHVGAMDYVTIYGGGDDRIIIVKVDPANIVSVPADYNFMKMRVSEYTVVEEYKGNLVRPLYHDDATPYDEDEDFDDEGWADEGDWDEDDDEPNEALQEAAKRYIYFVNVNPSPELFYIRWDVDTNSGTYFNDGYQASSVCSLEGLRGLAYYKEVSEEEALGVKSCCGKKSCGFHAELAAAVEIPDTMTLPEQPCVKYRNGTQTTTNVTPEPAPAPPAEWKVVQRKDTAEWILEIAGPKLATQAEAEAAAAKVNGTCHHISTLQREHKQMAAEISRLQNVRDASGRFTRKGV